MSETPSILVLLSVQLAMSSAIRKTHVFRSGGELYYKYHTTPCNHVEVSRKVKELYDDPCVTDNKNVFEYVLGGCQDSKLLNIRVFDDNIKCRVYRVQTAEAKANHVSNCPLCALGHDANHTKIFCKAHNRAKGNR